MLPKRFLADKPVLIDTHLARIFRLKKGVMTTARLVNDRLKDEKIRWVPLMVTLTYKDADAWKPNHISDYINRVQMWGKRKGYKLPYVWVMELQKRGAPHYHVLIWIPARLRLPYSDDKGWWSFGDSNTVRVHNPVGYVAKYASKLESKGCEFPHGARIHGIGGLLKGEKRVVAWWKLPKDLRQGEEGSCVWRRVSGGGWRNPETGEFVLPQWRIREGIWSANLVYVEKITVSKSDTEEHCAYKAWHSDRLRLLDRALITSCDLKAYSVRDRVSRYQEAVADASMRQSDLLAHLLETDHYAYCSFFERWAREVPAVVASPTVSTRLDRKDSYRRGRILL